MDWDNCGVKNEEVGQIASSLLNRNIAVLIEYLNLKPDIPVNLVNLAVRDIKVLIEVICLLVLVCDVIVFKINWNCLLRLVW